MIGEIEQNSERKYVGKSGAGRKQEYGVMGAIIGDVCGSIYEFRNRKTNDPKSVTQARRE